MKPYNLINAHFINLEKNYSDVNSISIAEGKIIAINHPLKNVDNIDLKGAYVIPGFIDAHFHIKNYGKRLQQLNLKGINSLDKIELLIKDKAIWFHSLIRLRYWYYWEVGLDTPCLFHSFQEKI